MASFSGPKLGNRIADDVPDIQALLSSLAQLTPDSGNTDYPVGTKRLSESANGYEFQQWNGTSWVTLETWNINVQKVDGFSVSAGTTANTIPVRDKDGKLPGDLTGNAHTATTARELSEINPISKGGTGASTAAEARKNLGVAPTSHASSGTDYGIGTSANYGHVKVSDTPDASLTEASGHALSPAGAKTELDKKLDTSGGTMSGPITFAGGGSVQKTNQPYKGELLAGAGNTRIWVFDEDSQELPGHVLIRGANTDFFVKNEGTCAVNGVNILTSAGGTMTGNLALNNAYCNKLNGAVTLGVGSTWNDAPSLSLYGPNATSGNPNAFVLRSGQASYSLTGTAEGLLQWGGKNILTSAGGTITDKLNISDSGVLTAAAQPYKGVALKNSMDAEIRVMSHDSETQANSILLRAKSPDASTSYDLWIGDNGNLTWNYNKIVPVINHWQNGNNFYIKYANGLIIQGGVSAFSQGVSGGYESYVTVGFWIPFTYSYSAWANVFGTGMLTCCAENFNLTYMSVKALAYGGYREWTGVSWLAIGM